MKIRNGFVSNSSSSSFLVAWDKRPQKLADVLKYVPNRNEAKVLFGWMKQQDGLVLCAPPQEKCETCTERFRCYTGNGTVEELARMIFTGGYEWDSEMDEMWYSEDNDGWAMEKAIEFFNKNKGMVAYCFRIADFGEGCDNETEANMRKGAWCEDVPAVEAWE